MTSPCSSLTALVLRRRTVFIAVVVMWVVLMLAISSTATSVSAAKTKVKSGKATTTVATPSTVATTTSIPKGAVAARVKAATTTIAKSYNLKADIEKRIVEVQRQAAPDLVVGAAVCPDTLSAKTSKIPIGTYSCVVTISGVKAPYNVIVKEGGFQNSGIFQVAPSKAIVSVGKIQSFIQTSLDPVEAEKAKISCGKAKVIVGDPGTLITCTLTVEADVQKLVFEIRNVNGLVALQETSTTIAASSTVAGAGSTTVAGSSTTLKP
jgi:hypothetical protein